MSERISSRRASLNPRLASSCIASRMYDMCVPKNSRNSAIQSVCTNIYVPEYIRVSVHDVNGRVRPLDLPVRV